MLHLLPDLRAADAARRPAAQATLLEMMPLWRRPGLLPRQEKHLWPTPVGRLLLA